MPDVVSLQVIEVILTPAAEHEGIKVAFTVGIMVDQGGTALVEAAHEGRVFVA